MNILRALPLALLPFGALADARPPMQNPEAAAPTEPATQLTLGQIDLRMTVPVAVSGSGPYPFIIDTGAERTVVSRQLAGQLQLLAGAPIHMTSMTERSQVSTVVVPGLSIASVGERHTITAPALDATNLGASGLLGIDTLANNKVTIDFEAGTMTVEPSRKLMREPRHAPDEIVVTARSRYGQLIVTDAYYGSDRIRVILDTGSQVTMGNSALRRRIRSATPPRKIVVTSVTGGKTEADYLLVPKVKVGDVQFDELPIAFADVLPFQRFGLSNRPALMLGMDGMRSFRRVVIDFPNRQVRFQMPRRDHRPLI